MPLEENKALARRAIDEIWSKGNLAVGPDIYSPNFLSHQHSHPDIGDVRGLSALIEFVREFREAFPDFHDTIDDQVAEGDKVVTGSIVAVNSVLIEMEIECHQSLTESCFTNRHPFRS